MISIRGAITIEQDTKEEVVENTKLLLEAIIKENQIDIDDIISIFFSATKDIKSMYPAVAARELEILHASLFCLQEMNVLNSMEKCIRILLHLNSDKKQSSAIHIYLKGAEVLRPDLAKKKGEAKNAISSSN